MKILFILPYSPLPPNFGGALRVYHMIRLAAQHHEISILTFGWPKDEFELRTHFGSRIRNIHIVSRHWPRKLRRLAQLYSLIGNHSFFYMLARSKDMQAAIDEVLDTTKFDIVQTEFAHMGSYELKTDGLRILDSHNVEYENFRRMSLKAHSPLRKLHYHSEYKKFYREELEACRRSDAVLVTSSRDKTILDADISGIPKYVIPNGVDASYFTPSSEHPESASLVFTGAMSYVPNYDGMLYFLDEIFPLILKEIPETTVHIVGSRPPKQLVKRQSKNVIVTGYVEDVRPYVWRSSVYIVPLRMGSGTRLKVLEAMAMQKPIITTSIGCEGIYLRDGESGIIADDPINFAAAAVRLLRDSTLRHRISKNAYELMLHQYEWSVIGDQLCELYNQLHDQKNSRQRESRERMRV